MRNKVERHHLRAVEDDTAYTATVEDRLRRAFPEVNLKKIAAGSTTLNEHNLEEKWAATVRTIQFWVDLAQ